jgi:hypothetical protein
MALLVIAVTLYVVFHLIFFNQQLAPSYCTAAPSFSCSAYALNKTGSFAISLYQATGGTINIKAAACSSAVNAVGDEPEYGNAALLSNAIAPQYYPSNSNLISTLSVPSSSTSAVMRVDCYNDKGIATGSAGTPFIGYLWINYTYSLLPSSSNVIQRVISFSTKFS